MSMVEKLWSSVSGLVRWIGVFVVGFVIGYGAMALLIDDPVAEELPIEVGVQNAPEPEEPTPIELPPLDVAEAPSKAAELPAKPTAPPEPDKREVPDAPAAAPEIPRPWWEACQDRRCRLDFGGISGNLTIRKATLVHGSTINWARDMAAKPRIASLPTERPLDVLVEAIAMSSDGQPAAAEIVWSRRGRAVRGVIALDLGEPGKRIVMHP